MGVTTLAPLPRGLAVERFESREDVMRVLLASCHIPFWVTPWPVARLRCMMLAPEVAGDGVMETEYGFSFRRPLGHNGHNSDGHRDACDCLHGGGRGQGRVRGGRLLLQRAHVRLPTGDIAARTAA